MTWYITQLTFLESTLVQVFDIAAHQLEVVLILKAWPELAYAAVICI